LDGVSYGSLGLDGINYGSADNLDGMDYSSDD
jgi:hypothetical protein